MGDGIDGEAVCIMTRTVLITRHPAECRDLQALLRPAGIILRPYPVLRLEELDDTPAWQELAATILDPRPDAATWLVFASPRAPERFRRRAVEHGQGQLLELPAAAVGDGTAQAARSAKFAVEIVGAGSGAALADTLLSSWSTPTTAVFGCGHERRRELPEILRRAGHTVLPVELYRMRPTPARELPPLGPSLDAVILTSPRSAQYYLQGVGGLPLPCPHWGLGRTTQEAARALGIDCRIPPEPTLESLAEELCKS